MAFFLMLFIVKGSLSVDNGNYFNVVVNNHLKAHIHPYQWLTVADKFEKMFPCRDSLGFFPYIDPQYCFIDKIAIIADVVIVKNLSKE